MTSSGLVEFCGEIARETASAIRVFDGAEYVWLPKSQIIHSKKVGKKPGDFEFTIPVWLAKEKGII